MTGLEFDIKFIIKADTIMMISWDDDRLKLGTTFWLGKPFQSKNLMSTYRTKNTFLFPTNFYLHEILNI